MIQDDKPLVSIITSTFNHEKYIRQCLDGLVSQKTNFKYECIIHDDASTDSTQTIIKEYAEKYPDLIKPILQSTNGYGTRRNAEAKINACRGKYVALCEGDDYWINPDKLQLQFDAMEQNPDCTLSYTKVNAIENDELKYTIPQNESFTTGIFTLNDFCNEEFVNGHWCFHTSSFFMRKSVYDEYFYSRPELFNHFPYSDMSLLLFGFTKGNCFYINDVTSVYRLFSGGYNSFMKQHPEKHVEHEEKLFSALLEFNKLTERKYEKQIKSRIFRGRRHNVILMNDYKKISNWKYLSKYEILKFGTPVLYNIIHPCYHFLKKLIKK